MRIAPLSLFRVYLKSLLQAILLVNIYIIICYLVIILDLY
nr:MAG TPA: hypothetical protein [Caudoviricetes sp.]